MDPVMWTEIRRLEKDNWWFLGMRRIASTLLENERFEHALDVGCGTGGNLGLLADVSDRVVAMDVALDSLQSLDSRWTRAGGDARMLPFRDGMFALVNLFNVAEHLDDDRAAFAAAYRVLRPGGLLLVATSAYQVLWSDHDDVNRHARRYGRKELEGKLCDVGFRIERTTFANTALLFPVFVVAIARRALKRYGLLRPYNRNLVDARGPANSMLRVLLYAEASLVRRRINMPTGVSIFVKARKGVCP